MIFVYVKTFIDQRLKIFHDIRRKKRVMKCRSIG